MRRGVKMIDAQDLIASIDLLQVIGTDTELKRVASTGGGEYAGPCPICGGHDRFRVQPSEKRWLCRHCTQGKWKDAISYVMLKENVEFIEACKILTGGNLTHNNSPKSIHKSIPAVEAPNEIWQTKGKGLVEECSKNLWGDPGKKALAYLRNRGLSDATIHHFRLGYFPEEKRHDKADEWGLEPDDKGNGVWLNRGILIPWFVEDTLWSINVRIPVGDPKYRMVKGSKRAIYNADNLLNHNHMALFVEGEFDCMIAWQYLNHLLPVVTLGAAKSIPDLARFGVYLLGLEACIACYDDDPPGQEGLAKLGEMTEFIYLAPLPIGPKDINDFVLSGGNVLDWFTPYYETYYQKVIERYLAQENY